MPFFTSPKNLKKNSFIFSDCQAKLLDYNNLTLKFVFNFNFHGDKLNSFAAPATMAGSKTLAAIILQKTNCQYKKAQPEDFADDFDNLISTLKTMNFLIE